MVEGTGCKPEDLEEAMAAMGKPKQMAEQVIHTVNPTASPARQGCSSYATLKSKNVPCPKVKDEVTVRQSCAKRIAKDRMACKHLQTRQSQLTDTT